MDKEPLDFGLNDDTWNATTEDTPVSKPRVYPTDAEIKQLFNEFGMEGLFSERQVVHRAIALYEEKNQ